jgi:predicted GNAT family acetyltransferase
MNMIDNQDRHRFELSEKGLLAFCNYRLKGDAVLLTHVEADPALRGTGAAGRLMEAIVTHARAQGLKLTPRCSYAVIWFKRHPEAGDVLE